jgi:hypothetical protein
VTNLGPRRAWAAAAAITAIAIAGVVSVASASVQTLVGVNQVTFAWQSPTGPITGYFVWRSLNGAPFQIYRLTVASRIDIPAAPGDQIAIQVAATGSDSAGTLYLGPRSPVSDTVAVLPAPQFLAATGSWLLRCRDCPAVERRPLADASLVSAQARGLLPPWHVLGHAALKKGADAIVWHNNQTGQLAVWDSQSLALIPGAVGFGATALRGIGGADLDGDGVEEFLIQRTDTLEVSVWGLTPNGFLPLASIAGPPGAMLAAARDFGIDGRVDLLWQNLIAGTLAISRLPANPVLSAAPSPPLTTTMLPPLAGGIPSNARVASTGDYDGDGSRDVLLRYANGGLAILYLNRGVLKRVIQLPSAPDDINRVVIDSVDIDGLGLDEIALRHAVTGEISLLFPSATPQAARVVVLDPGSAWRAIGID